MKKLKNIVHYIIPYWKHAGLNVIFNLLGVLFSVFSITMAIPFLGILFDNQQIVAEPRAFALNYETFEHNFNYYLSQIIVKTSTHKALLIISGLVIIMTFAKTFFTYMASFILAPLRTGVVRNIRNKLYNKILNLPLSYFSEKKKGDIISRMTNDVHEVEVSVLLSINAFFKEPFSILFYLATLLFMSPKLTLFVLLMLPITGGMISRIGITLRKSSALAQSSLGSLLSMIDETLSGLRIIKAFNSEKRSEKRFQEENGYYTRVMTQMWRRRDLASPLSEFLGTVVIVSIMWYGGTLVLSEDSHLSSQAFIGYLMIFYLIINPTKAFTAALYNIQKGIASAERINTVLDAELQITEKNNAQEIKKFNHQIEYRHVSFSYEDEPVLQDINLTIKKGQTIALVGQSGSGKSTMVDLLPRFYDLANGELMIDDKNIKDLKIKDLRDLMGNVNQESILFNDTIFNNIAFGVNAVSDEEVIQAAKVANAHDFIIEMPNGYQSNIGDRGGKLSGGQRQRISIARAVLKNPPILILDEATSALDTESEQLVQDALTRLMKNRTSIVIAHRLSTVQHADEICVMQQGRIVERGKHDELLKQNGIYTKLQNLQSFH